METLLLTKLSAWKKVPQKVEMSLLLHNTHCNPFRSLVVYKFQQIFNSHLAIKLLKASSILTFQLVTQKKRIFSSVGDFDKTFSWLSGDSLRTNRDSCIQVAFAKSSIFPVPDLDNFINFMLTKKAINLMQRLCRSHILTPFLFLATDLIGTSFIPTRKQLLLQSQDLLHILADARPFLDNRQHRS